MTYPVHALLRMSGPLYTVEQWSIGLRLITSDNAATEEQWVDQAETFLGDVMAPCVAWFERAASKNSVFAYMDNVSLNAISPDGTYADPGNPHDLAPPAPLTTNGASTNQMWPQMTPCLSLRTAVTRGYATHGRVYPPAAPGNDGNGRIATADALGMAQSFATLCEDISNLPALLLAGEPRVGVVSKEGAPGASRIVTQIKCGNVVDTQRRRRNALPEVYSDAAVVT